MEHIIKILLFLFLISGCSSNPTNADRTVLQKLNGESYESTNSLAIVTELPLLRKVQGHIYCGESISQTPAKLAKISLIKDFHQIGSTTSDITGKYTLLAKVAKQVSYNLIIEATCGSSSIKIIWENDTLKLNDIFIKNENTNKNQK
jgi:hypothetical protein